LVTLPGASMPAGLVHTDAVDLQVVLLGPRCPGRAFAEAEIALLVALLLSSFDVRLAGPGAGRSTSSPGQRQPRPAPVGCPSWPAPGVAPGDPAGLLPPPELRRQVGVRWPAGPCLVNVTRRRAPG